MFPLHKILIRLGAHDSETYKQSAFICKGEILRTEPLSPYRKGISAKNSRLVRCSNGCNNRDRLGYWVLWVVFHRDKFRYVLDKSHILVNLLRAMAFLTVYHPNEWRNRLRLHLDRQFAEGSEPFREWCRAHRSQHRSSQCHFPWTSDIGSRDRRTTEDVSEG